MKPIPKRILIPIITDLLEYREVAKHTISYTKKKVAKYGDVCEVSFTGIKSYFIHDPEMIKEILTTLGPKMKRTSFFRAFRKFLGNGLFTSDGDFHKQQRKLIKPVFYPQRIEEYAKIMVACATEEINNWKDGETININEAMTRITLKVITKAMFSSGLENNVIEEVGKNLQVAFDVMNKILSNPFYIYCLEKEIQIPVVKRFFKLKTELDKVVNGIIASYRKEGDAKRMDLLTMLMEAKDEDTGTGMTDEQIRDEVMTFFLAGHETTTLALTWTLYLIGKHPDIEKKFREEVKTTIHNRLPQASDYQALSFTKNIFKESLRLYPPAWTFAREPIEDVVIRDYHFPKGCVLWAITYLLHHNEKYFHDAEQFIPSRWDEEAIKEIPKYAYFPFGGGNRMCIGEGFAWMEGILVLATIATKCRLQLPKDFSTEINPVFTLKTKDAVMMKVIRN
ncbi:MAG: cytochrome P450 [Bacteroidia bacterium]